MNSSAVQTESAADQLFARPGEVTPPGVQVQRYLRAFRLRAVALTIDGNVVTAPDGAIPKRAVTVYWTASAAQAVAIVRRCEQTGASNIAAVAAELQIAVTPHQHVVERARDRVARIEAQLNAAKQSGALATFNLAYKAMRFEATSAGRRAMKYNQAYDRLRYELYRAVAGQPIDGGMIARALGITK